MSRTALLVTLGIASGLLAVWGGNTCYLATWGHEGRARAARLTLGIVEVAVALVVLLQLVDVMGALIIVATAAGCGWIIGNSIAWNRVFKEKSPPPR
jgi:hypothetical protein